MSWKRANDNETDEENFDEEELLGDGFSGDGEEYIDDDDHSSLLDDDDGADIAYDQQEFHSEANDEIVDTGQPVDEHPDEDEELLGDVQEEGDAAERDGGEGIGTLDTQVNDDEYAEFSEASNEADHVPPEKQNEPKVADAYTSQYKAPTSQPRSSNTQRFRGERPANNMQRSHQGFINNSQLRPFQNQYGPPQQSRDGWFRPNAPPVQFGQPRLMTPLLSNPRPQNLGSHPNQIPPQMVNNVFQNIPLSLRMRGPPPGYNPRPTMPQFHPRMSDNALSHGSPIHPPFILNNPVPDNQGTFAPRNLPPQLLSLPFELAQRPMRPVQRLPKPVGMQQQHNIQRQRSINSQRKDRQQNAARQQRPNQMRQPQQRVRPLFNNRQQILGENQKERHSDRVASSRAVSDNSKAVESHRSMPQEESRSQGDSSAKTQPAVSSALAIEYNHGLNSRRKRSTDGDEDPIPRKRTLLPSPDSADVEYTKKLAQQVQERERVRNEKEKRRLALAKSSAQRQAINSKTNSQSRVATALVKPQQSLKHSRDRLLRRRKSPHNSRQKFTQHSNSLQQDFEQHETSQHTIMEKNDSQQEATSQLDFQQQNTVQFDNQQQNQSQSNVQQQNPQQNPPYNMHPQNRTHHVVQQHNAQSVQHAIEQNRTQHVIQQQNAQSIGATQPNRTQHVVQQQNVPQSIQLTTQHSHTQRVIQQQNVPHNVQLTTQQNRTQHFVPQKNAPQSIQRAAQQNAQQHLGQQDLQYMVQETMAAPKSVPVQEVNYAHPPPTIAHQHPGGRFNPASAQQSTDLSSQPVQAGISIGSFSHNHPQQVAVSHSHSPSREQVDVQSENYVQQFNNSSGLPVEPHMLDPSVLNQNAVMHPSSHVIMPNLQQGRSAVQTHSEQQYLPSNQPIQSEQFNISQRAKVRRSPKVGLTQAAQLSAPPNTQQSVHLTSQAQMLPTQSQRVIPPHIRHRQNPQFEQAVNQNRQPTPPEYHSEQYDDTESHALQMQSSVPMQLQTNNDEAQRFSEHYVTVGQRQATPSASQSLPMQSSQQNSNLSKRNVNVSLRQPSRTVGAVSQTPKVKYRIHPLDLLSDEAELAKVKYSNNQVMGTEVDNYMLDTSADDVEETSQPKQTLSLSAHINPRHLKRVKERDGTRPVPATSSKRTVVKCSTLNERFKQHYTDNKQLKKNQPPLSTQTSGAETRKLQVPASTQVVRRRQPVANEMTPVIGRGQRGAVERTVKVSPRATLQRTISRSITPVSSISSMSSLAEQTVVRRVANTYTAGGRLCCKILNLDRNVPVSTIRQMGEEVAVVNKVGRLKKNPSIVIITFAEESHALSFRRQYNNAEVMGNRIKVEFVSPKSSSTSKS